MYIFQYRKIRFPYYYIVLLCFFFLVTFCDEFSVIIFCTLSLCTVHFCLLRDDFVCLSVCLLPWGEKRCPAHMNESHWLRPSQTLDSQKKDGGLVSETGELQLHYSVAGEITL